MGWCHRAEKRAPPTADVRRQPGGIEGGQAPSSRAGHRDCENDRDTGDNRAGADLAILRLALRFSPLEKLTPLSLETTPLV